MKIIQGNQALQLSTIGRINVIYGYTGSGKSSLALTATKNNRVLYIDVENAVGKVWGALPEEEKNVKNLNVAQVLNVSELIEFLEDPNFIHGYDLVVIDSLTFLAEQELGNVTDKGKKLSFHDYGNMGNAIKRVLRQVQMRGISVDILMQAERIQTEDEGEIFYPRAAGNMIAPAAVERADNIIYIKYKNGKRTGHTIPTDKWHAKRRDPLPEVIQEEDLYYSKLEEMFATYEAVEADPKELEALIKKAKVTKKEKLYKAIGWKPGEKFYEHQLTEASFLLKKKLEAVELEENISKPTEK